MRELGPVERKKNYLKSELMLVPHLAFTLILQVCVCMCVYVHVCEYKRERW